MLSFVMGGLHRLAFLFISTCKHKYAKAHKQHYMHLFYSPPKEKPSKRVYLNHSGLVGVCSHPSWEPEKTQSNALGVQDHLSLMTGHSLLITYSSVPARLIITALNKDVMKTPLYFSVPLRVQLSALDQRSPTFVAPQTGLCPTVK